MKKLFIGIKRHPKSFVWAIVFGFTVLWTVIEPVLVILNVKTTEYSTWYLASYTMASFIISLIFIFPKKKVEFGLKNTNTKVIIKFGNLFEEKGYKVISVNNFFDSKVGKPVSPNSLHGIFITKVLEGEAEIFKSAVKTQLKDKESVGVNEKNCGEKTKYNIGDTIVIEKEKTKYFCFSMTESDKNCVSSSSPDIMLKALNGLWSKVLNEANGHDVVMPLVGDGLSRIGLPKSQLLQLILISLLNFVKQKDLSSTVKIILTEKVFSQIDLEIIKNNWE